MKGSMERKERLSVRETRAALINAGCDLFLQPQTDWGLGRISIGEAISRSEVSRASAYRAFSDGHADPQDAFRISVLLEVISRTAIDTAVVGQILASIDPHQFAATPNGKAAELREVIRLWMNTNLDSNRQNDLVRAVDVCRAVIGLSPNPDPEVLAAVQKSSEQSREQFYPYVVAISDRYGIRPRPWTSTDQVQRLIVGVVGMATTEWSIDETTRVIVRPTGPDGADQEWSLNGIIVEGIILTMGEPDPAAAIPANLKSWLS